MHQNGGFESIRQTRENKLSINSQAIAKAAILIASADGLMITAGAGMSVDSGLPDYRGDKGFWQNYVGIGVAEVPYERLSSSSGGSS